MASGGSDTIIVLYKVVNSDSDADDPCFNAFPLKGGKPTLATVKQNCAALYSLNRLGPEGYHWRVFVEDKSAPGDTGPKTFSWWDIQDDNASLPVKESSQHQLGKFFGPPKMDTADAATKAAKGAFKTLGKAVSQAVGVEETQGPPVKVVAFKLLNLVKMHDDFERNRAGRVGQIPQNVQVHQSRVTPQTASHVRQHSQPTPARSQASAATPHTNSQQRRTNPARPPPSQQKNTRPVQEASLMDFGMTTPPARTTTSAPTSSFNNKAHANETRAEKLKREYAKKNQNAQRVWDDIDQRWVDAGAAKANKPPPANAPPKKKEVGIKLDPANAVGKSAAVQAAVNNRVNEMKESQAKALQEVRQREEKKAQDEADEDEVRKRLTPKIKQWSEEHGQKKQLRALLASLHTILWADSKWKQVTIGDLLDDKKVKLAFHKASRVVHPDKTHHLDAEKRFVAKRIFDALSQAKTEFDAGK